MASMTEYLGCQIFNIISEFRYYKEYRVRVWVLIGRLGLLREDVQDFRKRDLHVYHRALYFHNRALYFRKRALHFSQVPLNFRRRALYFRKQALYFHNQVLYFHKRAKCFLRQALHFHIRALHFTYPQKSPVFPPNSLISSYKLAHAGM